MNINSLCYLGLGFLSVILLLYVCYIKGIKRSLLLYLAMVGLGYMIEAIIYNFLGSYQYYPKLLKHDRIYDSNMGAIASNFLALPVTATYIASFHRKWLWIAFFTGLFAVIEWVFIKLHIYKHNWWKIGYTSLGLPFYYLSAKFLIKKMVLPLKGVLHSLVLFLVVGAIQGTFHMIPIMLFSSRYYQLGWWGNPSKDTTAFAAVSYLCATLFYVIVAKIPYLPKWLKYVITPVCMYAVTIILRKSGILHSQVWWDPWYYIIFSIIALWFTESISRCLSKGL
ncbi:hypothetical protein [Neobacillus drentensis]|uniref:hypothetical protein n=1 Tax=Neobacillus drentensis TaxID=220684 RepID=UPI002FFF83B6